MTARDDIAAALVMPRAQDPRAVTEALNAFRDEVLREAAARIREVGATYDAADLIDPDKEQPK